MGLEKVIEEILAAGEAKRSKILSEANEEKRKIISTAQSEAEASRKAREADMQRRMTMSRQQALSSAELESKKRLLQEKNQMLAKAKEETLEALKELGQADRKQLLDKLCKAAAKELSKGVIHCLKADDKLVTAPSGFKKAADLSYAGGILAESEDGSYRINLTYEALLDDLWAKDVRKIYETLFGGA